MWNVGVWLVLVLSVIMQVFRSLAALIFTALLATASAASCTVDAQDKCRCNESASSFLDVGCFFTYPFEFKGTVDNTTYTFRFSPCGETECPPQTGAVCQYSEDLDRWFVLGRVSDITWTINSDSPLDFTIQYGDGEVGPDKTTHRKSLVTFMHSESSETEIHFIQEEPQLVYHFQVVGSEVKVVDHYSPCGGGGGREGGGVQVGPIGLAIIFLALAALVAYFVVGGVINYKVKGARGSEVIPNISFWREFPFLIKDGFVLTFSPCISKLKRTKPGYDSV